MFGYTPREIAGKIRRCTVYDAANYVLKLFPHHGLYTDEIDKLNKMIKNRSATWYKLSRIVSKISDETYDVNDIEILTIVRVRQTVIGCFRSYFFLFVAVNSGDRLGLLFRRDSR